MENCCTDIKSMCDKFDFGINETEKGINVDITPKDSSKTESFKTLVKACREVCGCC